MEGIALIGHGARCTRERGHCCGAEVKYPPVGQLRRVRITGAVRVEIPLRRGAVRVTALACTNIPGTPAAAVSVSAVWRIPCHGRNDAGTFAFVSAFLAYGVSFEGSSGVPSAVREHDRLVRPVTRRLPYCSSSACTATGPSGIVRRPALEFGDVTPSGRTAATTLKSRSSRSTSLHRSPSSSPRRRPVESATTVILRAVSTQNRPSSSADRFERPVGGDQIANRLRIKQYVLSQYST